MRQLGFWIRRKAHYSSDVKATYFAMDTTSPFVFIAGKRGPQIRLLLMETNNRIISTNIIVFIEDFGLKQYR